MKKYIIIFFFIFVFGLGIVRASILPLSGKIIYLDPGHGGKDPGAIYKDIYEADINLQICFKLKDILERKGAKVYMTRYGDYDLSTNNVSLRKRSDLYNRAKIINASNADLYVSIHLNADSNSKWNGAQVFYNDVNVNNKKIAEIMQRRFKDLGSNRDYKKITTSYMHRLVKIQGVLVEAGFITNTHDRNLLVKDDYQIELSNIIADSIIEYCKVG